MARLSSLVRALVPAGPAERRTLLLAMALNFTLLCSYYILRPVRDTMATVVGVDQLQNLFSATFVLTLGCSPLFAALASRLPLQRFLPGLFWFWLANILLFAALLHAAPPGRWLAAAYYVWFSVTNLYMISVFWTLMVDLYTARQATRLFAPIAAAGSVGAIAGPIVTRYAAQAVGLDGLLLIAAGGFGVLILLVQLLVREKARLRHDGVETQSGRLDQALPGGWLDGFRVLFRSRYVRAQALFMLLMTWAATVAYFRQTELVAAASSAVTRRTELIADIDLAVNVISAAVLIFGLGAFMRRYSVTAALVASPLIMVLAFMAFALWPTLLMIQLVQVLRRVSQYAIARPSREVSFTVLDQHDRYKAKNVIDTAVYRLGDVSAAWLQAGIRAAGLGAAGAIGMGVVVSAAWGGAAVGLGRRYERLRAGAPDHKLEDYRSASG